MCSLFSETNLITININYKNYIKFSNFHPHLFQWKSEEDNVRKKEASKSMYGLEKAVMYDNDWFMFSLILKKDCHNRT